MELIVPRLDGMTSTLVPAPTHESEIHVLNELTPEIKAVLEDNQLNYLCYSTIDKSGIEVIYISNLKWADRLFSLYPGKDPMAFEERKPVRLGIESWDHPVLKSECMEDRKETTESANGVICFSYDDQKHMVEQFTLGWKKHDIEQDPRALDKLILGVQPIINKFYQAFNHYYQQRANISNTLQNRPELITNHPATSSRLISSYFELNQNLIN